MIKKILLSLRSSLCGLFYNFGRELSFKLECLLTVILIPIPFLTQTTTVEKVLLIGVLLAVMLLELMNTGIEKLGDAISSAYNENIRIAKDSASGAVFLSLLLAAFVWGMIYLC